MCENYLIRLEIIWSSQKKVLSSNAFKNLLEIHHKIHIWFDFICTRAYPEVLSLDLLRNLCHKNFAFMLKYNFSNLVFVKNLFDNDMHEWARTIYLTEGWYEKNQGIFFRKFYQVSGPSTNYWTHILTISDVDYHQNMVF